MKFSELLGDEQPAEMPPGANGRPPDVPALVDEVAAAAPAPVDAFDASLDSQLDALPGPDASAFAPEPIAEPVAEPTPVRFSEPEPYQPEPEAVYEAPPEPYQPEPEAVYEAPPEPYQPEPEAVYEAPPEPYQPEPEPEVEPVESFTPVARPTTTSVFGGGRVEAQSSGLASLNVPEAEEAEAVDDAMRIARLDAIDDDILPTTRRRSKK